MAISACSPPVPHPKPQASGGSFFFSDLAMWIVEKALITEPTCRFALGGVQVFSSSCDLRSANAIASGSFKVRQYTKLPSGHKQIDLQVGCVAGSEGAQWAADAHACPVP